MPSPVAGDQIVRVEFRHLLHGNAVWNVFHAFGADTITDLVTEGQLMADSWVSWVLPSMTTTVRFDALAIQRVWPDVGALIELPQPNSGGIIGEAVANQTALVVSHQSLFPGRRARGRTYLGGFQEAFFDGTTGRWQAAWAAARAGNLTSMWNDPLVGVNWEPVIWSTGSAIGPSPQYYAIFNFVAKTVPGVIRSRRLGQGI